MLKGKPSELDPRRGTQVELARLRAELGEAQHRLPTEDQLRGSPRWAQMAQAAEQVRPFFRLILLVLHVLYTHPYI